MIRLITITILTMFLANFSFAQNVAIKTNLVHDATLTHSLAVEVGLDMKTTLEIYGGYNWFDFNDNKKWKHWIIQPEVRWWLCERYNGSYLGIHLSGGEFNVGGIGPFEIIKNGRFDGYFYGLGMGYGYQWILSNHWSFELGLGIGYAHIKYDRYKCHECSPKIKSGHYNYFGPTKVQISFVLLLW